jgi:anthranilate phosphoribosyltransferase
MNAAAALWVAGRAEDFPGGVALAREAIASGKARDVLDFYVALTREPTDV